MVTNPLSKPLTAYFGKRVLGVPEFGIFVPYGKKWCSCVSSQQESKHSEIVTSFNPAWDIFDGVKGFSQLKHCQDVTEHYDTVCFKVDAKCKYKEYQFGFYFDNEQLKDDEYALFHIYSHQEKSRFSALVAYPDIKGNLLRFDDCNRALTLSCHKSVSNTSISSKEQFSSSIKNDVCAFTVMVTTGKETIQLYAPNSVNEYSDDVKYDTTPINIYNFVINLKEK